MDGMSEEHNQAYYDVEEQRFLGEERFGEEISREVGETEQRKAKEPIEKVFRKIARAVHVAPGVCGERTVVGRLRRSVRRRWQFWFGSTVIGWE